MDWSKVIEQLRWFGKNSLESANAARMEYGKHDAAQFYGRRADLYYTLAAALECGLEKKP